MVSKCENLDIEIKNVLEDAPKIEGYSIQQLTQLLNRPFPTIRWHLELLAAKGDVEFVEIGRAKVYKLKRNSEAIKNE